jgi:hypothetical protein
VLVVDLVPRQAGADIPVPEGDWSLDLHVSHHGPVPLAGHVHAAWVAAGQPFGSEPAPSAGSPQVEAHPFRLTGAITLALSAPGGPARLLLWLTDESGAVRARTFVDAAPIEEPNRRGARA